MGRYLNLLLTAVAWPLVTCEKPNVIIFLVDDLGYGDLGYTGKKSFIFFYCITKSLTVEKVLYYVFSMKITKSHIDLKLRNALQNIKVKKQIFHTFP
jgi:hypothetical protein